MCIQLYSKRPYKTLIFCSETICDKYEELADYKKYPSVQEEVKILTTTQALIILDLF